MRIRIKRIKEQVTSREVIHVITSKVPLDVISDNIVVILIKD